jgi:hypothetical protein
VPRLFGDQVENDQAKIAMREEPAEPGLSAVTVPPASELMIILVAVFPAGKPPVVVTVRVSMMHGIPSEFRHSGETDITRISPGKGCV